MKRYCFLLYNVDPGGLEVYLLRFLQHYQGAFEATVICKSGRTGMLLKGYEATGAKVIGINTGYVNPFSWYAIYSEFKNGDFDAVIDLTSNFAGVYMWIAYMAKIKVREAYYGQSTNHFRNSSLKRLYDKWINKLVYQFSTSIVFNSKDARSYYFGYVKQDDKRFQVIYNGVDSSQFNTINNDNVRRELHIPEDAFVLGHTGRFDEKKNHTAIIQVAKQLMIKHPHVYLVCCGKDTEQLQSWFDREGISKSSRALGYRADVHRILSCMNVFYFPSYTEGQPNSLIEAMMAGLPFVASNIQPIKDTVPKNLWFQLVEPDDTHAAVELIEKMMGLPDLTSLTCRDWALEKYNARDRFKEFLLSFQAVK